MSNIHGLFGKKKDDSNKDEEFNVGGATSSTAVVRPTKRDANELMSSLAQRASAQGGDADDAPQGTPIPIVVYQNGILADGKWYPLADDALVAALEKLKEGEVPILIEKDIVAKHGPAVEKIGVAVLNKVQERYTPPKQPFSFAESKGQVLISTFTGAASDLGMKPAKEHVPSESDPKITLLLNSHDRQRHRITMSANATVEELYQHVKFLTKCSNFELLAGFPPKPLMVGEQTVTEAKLSQAQVNQRAL